MRRLPARLLVALLLGACPSLLRAEDAPATRPVPGAGTTYTAEELEALDRALHAGNMDRADLEFHKDMAKGHGCLPIVRAMLREPLLIAPTMDALAAATEAAPDAPISWRALLGVGAALLGEAATDRDLAVALARLDHDLPVPVPTPPPATPSEAVALLEAVLARQPVRLRAALAELGEDERDVAWRYLRRALPTAMAMHEVNAFPVTKAEDDALEAYGKAKPPAHLHELAARLPLDGLLHEAWSAFGPLLASVATWPAAAFPTAGPLVVETPHGRIALGTAGDDLYEGEYAAIVDPAGDDRYREARVGATTGEAERGVGLLVDLGGDDVYACRDVDGTLGAALFGIAAFLDLGQGDDRYEGGHASLGAAVGGVALFLDDGGSDTYEGKTFTQGAAAFGFAAFVDDARQAPPVVTSDEGTKEPVVLAAFDNDRLTAWANAQALARPRGVAFCVNRRGNDLYEAGGVYLHAPLFADRYQSFAQGFSIGSREVDWAGGVALLVDRDGNDRYLGDVYDQGVGYWYAAGLLWDGGGNDLYEMTQYGQGSGIHLAVGGLVDVSGSDAYVMHSGLGQGGSHDFAASILHDRGGNDRYHGNTSCNGCGLTNSVGIHLDRAGDDTYVARREGGWNAGRPARGFGSVGVFVDLGGKDDYLGPAQDGGTWRSSDVGVGVDVAPAAAEPSPTAVASAPDGTTGRAPIPAVCAYEGALEAKVFEELWALACRWEVGENRAIVPKARARLVAFGKEVLPYVDGKLEEEASGLEMRAYVDVLGGLGKAGAREEVLDLLRRNAASPLERRRKVALYLVGELAAKELDDVVAAFVADPDPALARRAAGVLAALGSHAGDEVLVGWLARTEDEPAVLAALGALTALEADVYPRLRPLLDHGRVSVRSRLATSLAEHATVYGGPLAADVVAGGLPVRALRTALDAFARATSPPTPALVTAVEGLLEHGDWGVRGDAARLVRAWGARPAPRLAELEAALVALDRHLEAEPDPFVQASGRAAPAGPPRPSAR